MRQKHPPPQHLPLIPHFRRRNPHRRQRSIAQQHRQPPRIPLIVLMPPFHPSLGGQRMRQPRLVPGGWHLIYDPVVTAAGLQRDLRSGRQFLQKLPELLPVVAHTDRPPVFASLVHRRKHRELLVRVTSDKLFHIRCSSFPSWGSGLEYARTPLQRFHRITERRPRPATG